MHRDDKRLYDCLHDLLDAATQHFDECDTDLLDCTCGRIIDGDALVDLMLIYARTLRDGEP